MIGLISDIHGNAAALRAVLTELDTLGVERIVCLGDVAGYGPQINECCALIRKREIPTLIGNHDFYMAFDEPCPRSRAANFCLDYQRSVIESHHKTWLGTNPRHLDLPGGIRMVHGGWKDPIDEYLYVLSPDYFAALDGELFISGHTHVQGVWPMGAKTYCNPGSVGQPRDCDPRAAFAVLDGLSVTLKRIAYNIDEIARASHEAGYPTAIYDNLYLGARIGGTISRVRAE